jgi:hypothetical protein
LSTNPTSSNAVQTATDASPAPPKWLNRWFQVWLDESGTMEILQLKEKVNGSSLKFDEKQRLVVEARRSLDVALKAWEDSQSQHTQLLQVRDKWTPTQAQEFSTVVQEEVRIRNDLQHAKQNLSEREAQQASTQVEYMNDLRRRYHEEQIWQDKWRIMSTFGTWGLIVLNSFVFLISQYLYRLRETKRSKDTEGLLYQTLSSNTSTLQAIQEQQKHQQRQHQLSQNEHGSSADVQEDIGQEHLSTSTQEPSISTDDSETVSTKQDSSEGLTEKQNIAVSSWSWRERLAGIVQQKEAMSIGSWRVSLVSAWEGVQQNVIKNISFPHQVDLPSALLGASVTGLAWIAAVALSSKKPGQ